MKKIFVILSILTLFSADCKRVRHHRSLPKGVTAQSVDKKTGLSDAKQIVLMDFDTGEILYEKNSKEKCAPSSMTKLMTIYLLFLAIKDGRIAMDDEFWVSEEAQKMREEHGEMISIVRKLLERFTGEDKKENQNQENK